MPTSAIVTGVGTVLLMPPAFGAELEPEVQAAGYGPVSCVNSREALSEVFATCIPQLLLAFSTGVVVPTEYLARDGLLAVNIHGAPPSYPGRDPHHFAAYDGATCYGATLHRMVAAVDQGAVIRVSLQEVSPTTPPHELMAIGVRHGLALARAFLAELARGRVPAPDPQLRWTASVRRRRDFQQLCRIAPDIDRQEFERRLHATSMPGYSNLVLTLHGHTFRLDPP
ncbi:MAG: hypothetical protein H0X13_01720 [Ramlibacter sp.]|nr:hypothetical protein [Ramlibacter sp.]